MTDVTVVIPALNEAADIAGCIESIARQAYGQGIEIVLVDGLSADATVAVALSAAIRAGLPITVLRNPLRRTSTSLNLALQIAKGDIVVRIDARSRVEPHYVSSCAAVLQARPEIGVVGGAQVAEPRDERTVSIGITRALRNRWATGFSRYRRSDHSGPADTVWMGAFRTAELRALSGWDSDVAINEDYDLNARYREAGKVVWFDATLQSGYLPRRTVGEVARQHFRFGKAKGGGWACGVALAARHAAIVALPVLMLALATWSVTHLGLGLTCVLATIAVATIDVVGGRGPMLPWRARPVAWLVMATMVATWWCGVVVGFARGSLARRPSTRCEASTR